ncbi:MAG TPA: FAD-linked oxidase C-terminal domain-containing protein [bacterium]|nr:FAD-linked oxidase C-terminal domain-containing protein [bacterium]
MSPSSRDLAEDLRRVVRGEVRFDAVSRVLYSTDASIYEIEPIGVVIPRDADDVQATLEVAHRARVPVLPRGGGTSLAGQAVGHAVVLDFSKYMNRILEVDPEAGWARVEPGLVRNELANALAPRKMVFGPETSTGNRATIGGMIGNNSSGARSIVFGKTVDNTISVRALLAGGEAVALGPLDEAEVTVRARREGAEGVLYRRIPQIVERTRSEVARRYPKIQRRVGGYNLDEFPPGGPWNLAKLVVGSEGTLATVTEATVRIVPRLQATVLAVLHFDDIVPALETTPEILDTHPTAVELIDKIVLDMARQMRDYSTKMTFVEGDPAALIVVEYAGETPGALLSRLDALESRMRRRGFGGAIVRAIEPAEQANLWQIRSSGVGLLLGMKAARKPVAFVEDTAVAPDRVAEYVRRFRDIVERHGTRASFYGHASVGLLHARPILDLREAKDIDTMRQIAEEVSDLVQEFGGAMSGEHGDGLSRSHFNEKLFGPQIYHAFREIKAAFDPEWRMNPGKVVDAPPMTESLRYGTAYRASAIQTVQDFGRDGGLTSAVELCSGVGACRKPQGGTMCPSYMVTKEEAHSTRGRANALRAAISGHLPREALTGRGLYEVMDLCIGCKACKAECPSNVDMAKLKHEFLAHYYAAHGVPLRARMFGHVAAIGPMGCATAPVSNWVMGSPPFRWLLHRTLGIHPRRRLPAFSRQRFTGWFRRRGGSPRGPEGAAKALPGGGRVMLLVDTFTEYYYPAIGQAAVRLLEAAGCEVVLAPSRCCGRPMISNGLLREAQALALANTARLRPYADAGIPIVGLEPSCTVTLKDEYPDLAPGDASDRVARQTFMIEEFLVQLQGLGISLPLRRRERRVLLHGHCHQKAMVGTQPSLAALRWLPGATVAEVDSGCCGMAGSFGYEAEHYAVSLAMGERALFKAVRDLPADALIVAAGASCRQQILHGTGRPAVHLVEALAAALAPPER